MGGAGDCAGAGVQDDSPLATEFQEVPCEVRTAEVEKIGGGLSRHNVANISPGLPRHQAASSCAVGLLFFSV